MAAGLTYEALHSESLGGNIQEVGKALLASLAVHQELRKDLVQGLCLFKVAAYRLHSGGNLDLPKAERVASLVKDKVRETASKVVVSNFVV